MKSLIFHWWVVVSAAGLAVTPEAGAQAPALVHPDCLISQNGIGLFKPGMTIAQFRETGERLAPGAGFVEIENFMVDFSALALVSNHEPLVYALVFAGEQSDPATVVEAMITTSPFFRMENGVGAGMLLKEVEKLLGPVTLSWNMENESREYIRFGEKAGLPLNISMRAASPSFEEVYAGIYPEGDAISGPEVSAKGYRPMAFIHRIEVSRIFEPEQ